MREATVDSDNFLFKIKLRTRINKARAQKEEKTRKYNIEKLKNKDKRKKYLKTLVKD